MGAFLSGLFSAVGPRLEEKHQQELALQTQKKQGEYNTYWNSMQTAATKLSALKSKGQLTPEEEKEAQSLASQYAWSEQQLGKLTKGSKELGGAFQKVGGFVKQLLTKPSPRGQLQPPSQQSSPQSDGAQPQSQSTPTQLQPPSGPSMQSAMALAAEQSPEAQKRAQAEADRQRRTKTGKELNLSGRDLAEYEETGKLPSQPAAGTRKQVRFQLADGKSEVDVQYDPKTGVYYDNRNEPYEIPEGAKLVASKTSAARPTILSSDYVNLDDAKSLKGSGVPFLGADGKEVDLDKVPKGMVLQKIHYADGRTLYEPRNINDKVVTVGNVKYAVNPSQVQGLPQGAGTELGVANPGSSGTRGQITVDAEGNPTVTNLPSTRTPVTTGVPGRGATPPPASGATPHANTPTAASPTARPPASATQPHAATPPSSGTSPKPPGIPVGMYKGMLERITPVREAATQLFGDPSQPDIKGLKDFASLADNEESRKRLGKALKLTFDSFSKATGESGIHAGAGPVSLNASGGVIQLIENAFGVPPKLAEQSAQIMQNALKDLTPEEREAYNATMSAFGTIVGLRSLTRASAAQASVATIEREMPIIGVNTTNSDQFADQMTRLAEIVYNGTKGVPKAMWEQTPGLLDRIKTLPSEAKKMKKPAASPKGTLQAPADKVKVWDEASGTFK